MDKQIRITNIKSDKIDVIKINKDLENRLKMINKNNTTNKNKIRNKDKKFLYKLLLIALPSTIIDIILDFSLASCNYKECTTLFLFNGVNCKNCDLEYCSNQCYNYTTCKICNNQSCEYCFIECRTCNAYCCFSCIYKEMELDEVIYICATCDWYGIKNDRQSTVENSSYDGYESND